MWWKRKKKPDVLLLAQEAVANMERRLEKAELQLFSFKHPYACDYADKDETGKVKVIVRSNEDEPYKVGHFVGFDDRNTEIPLVEIDGSIFFCMGLVLPYYEETRQALDKLTPKEQWNVLSRHYKRV